MGLIGRWQNRGSFICSECKKLKNHNQLACASGKVCDGCWLSVFERKWDQAEAEAKAKEETEKQQEHRKLVSALKVALTELHRTPPLSDDELRNLIGCAMTHGSLPQVGSDSFVQPVPDHCDRITWRGHYIHLAGLVKST